MKEYRCTVDMQAVTLIDNCRVYKSERLLKQLRGMTGADRLLDGLASALLAQRSFLPKPMGRGGWRVALPNGDHTFWCVLGSAIDGYEGKEDLIFCGYDSTMEGNWKQDSRFAAYVADNATFVVTVTVSEVRYNRTDFAKLYRLCGEDRVYFPCLSATQRALVTAEDTNMLVQGVAGSGKTNICIDKIVYCACRHYSGKVLYTTYSRGLLLDTADRVAVWRDNVLRLVHAIEQGRVHWLGKDRQQAVANRLGLYLGAETGDDLVRELQYIADFLDTHVDYLLIEDIYRLATGKRPELADEGAFVNRYLGGMRNYNLSGRLDKLRGLSAEVIYKEIYGLIEGWCNPSAPQSTLTLAQYTAMRQEALTKSECDTLYGIAADYAKWMDKNGLTDNNRLSRKLLTSGAELPQYSLVIADEVQDFAQVTLTLLKAMGRKMFCVGDALQMINPSYFQFAYLKRLLFDKDTARVSELQYNYRSSHKIEQIIDELGAINARQFGTHAFVLRGHSLPDEETTRAVYVQDRDWVQAMAACDAEDVTVIVPDRYTKDKLRAALPRQEILTVSEIKGLERDTVVLYHLLGRYDDQWKTLQRRTLNRKTADENSVYRYYFNLFYVGVSRAKRHLFVVEKQPPTLFVPLLGGALFEQKDQKQALEIVVKEVGQKLDVEELLARVEQFVSQGQYDNAAVAAAKLPDSAYQLQRIAVYRDLVHRGEYKEAGIAFWQLGALPDARRCLTIAKEDALLSLMEATTGSGQGNLSVDLLRVYPDVMGEPAAKQLLEQVVNDDLQRQRERLTTLRRTMKNRRKENR